METPILSPWTLQIPDPGRHRFGGFQYICSGYHGLRDGRRYWQWGLQYFLLGHYRYRIRRRHRFGGFQYICSGYHGLRNGQIQAVETPTLSPWILRIPDRGETQARGIQIHLLWIPRTQERAEIQAVETPILSPWTLQIPDQEETQVPGIPIHLLWIPRTRVRAEIQGSGDSNSFSLDTTDTGSGGDTGSGDSNTFALDTTDSGTGGDTGSGTPTLSPWTLQIPDQEETPVHSGDSNTFALDTTDQGQSGSEDTADQAVGTPNGTADKLDDDAQYIWIHGTQQNGGWNIHGWYSR